MKAGYEQATCPCCDGQAIANRWEGHCDEGGYDEVLDQHGCGWHFDYREDAIRDRAESRMLD